MKNDTNNEVARLRETLELIASPMRPDGTYNRDRRACELLAKEALAPAPEEPVIQENRITEPSPEETQDGATMDEWRELGPDEVIQEGDECRFKGEAQYEPLMDSMIGGKPKRFRFYLSRSRRRLADKYREQLNQNKMNPQTPARWLTPTKIQAKGAKAEITYPEAINDQYQGKVEIAFAAHLPQGESGIEFELVLTYQACTDTECLPPAEKVFTLVVVK